MKTVKHLNRNIGRRTFLKKAGLVAAGSAFTYKSFILPDTVFGKSAPSEKITLGCIGLGRMGIGDLKSFLQLDDIHVVAVCDTDSKRAENAKAIVQHTYSDNSSSNNENVCANYSNFQQVIDRDDIDAIMICTPDHWHAIPALAAAKAGKDIFLQKPLTYTIEEGRVLSDAIKRYGNVFQVGSQQRSDDKFRFACELVRNGLIGDLQKIEVGFGKDHGSDVYPSMPVPDNLDYDQWLGPAPEKPYTEKRVHPQDSYDRPGWMTVSDYSHGMITNWGAHHIDIAHWGMGIENSGPAQVTGWADYPSDGLWDVHQRFYIEYVYDNGVIMRVSDNESFKQGVVFYGSEGWVHVKRGFIDASSKSLLTYKLKPADLHLYKSLHHKRNFVDCIKNRSETVAPVENAHRSNTACILGQIAMKLQTPLKWDPLKEVFLNSEPANRLLSRTDRVYKS